MNIQKAFAKQTPVNHQHNAGGKKYWAEASVWDWHLVPPGSALASQPFLMWGKVLLQKFAGCMAALSAALPTPFPATQHDNTARAELLHGG